MFTTPVVSRITWGARGRLRRKSASELVRGDTDFEHLMRIGYSIFCSSTEHELERGGRARRQAEQSRYVLHAKSNVERRHIVIISCPPPCRSSSSSTPGARLLGCLPVQPACVSARTHSLDLTCVVEQMLGAASG
jgi:hypothetical protein